jgi:hypothetical protein
MIWTPASSTLKCKDVLSEELLNQLKTQNHPKSQPLTNYPTQPEDNNSIVPDAYRDFKLEWAIGKAKLIITGRADHQLIETIHRFDIGSGTKKSYCDWVNGQKEWLLKNWDECRLTELYYGIYGK